MANGFFSMQGTQVFTQQGGRNGLGPFNIPFGPITDTSTYTVNTTATIPVPATALGVVIIPPTANTTPTVAMSLVSSGSTFNIGPGTPTEIQFDPAHMPANLYLLSGSSVAIVVQFV